MPSTSAVTIGPIKPAELPEADRIFRLAFGTFLNLPNPPDFMGDRDLMASRFRAPHTKVIAARDAGRIIGSNIATRWGSFGFFGPLTVLPEYQDRGVAKMLLGATVATFDQWGLRHTGLFTFPHSAKHIGLYQKFGYWPRYLTALMSRTPELAAAPATLLSALPKTRRELTIKACANLTHRIDKGLDLSAEMRTLLKQRTGDVVLTHTRNATDGFAICLTGPGSEGGSTACYVKFAAVRGGAGAAGRFEKLLDGIDAFAAARGVTIEAGISLARVDAFRAMRAHGYIVKTQGVAMHRPHAEGFNRADAWIIDDWR